MSFNSSVRVRVSVVMINTMTESSLGKKGFISPFSSTLQSVIEGRLGRTTRQKLMLKPGRNAVHWHAHPAFLYATQDHMPRVGTTHSGLRPPTSIMN